MYMLVVNKNFRSGKRLLILRLTQGKFKILKLLKLRQKIKFTNTWKLMWHEPCCTKRTRLGSV